MRDTPTDFLEQAVNSVLAQTDPSWELLLFDDGSGASASEFARRLSETDAVRIRYCEHDGHVNRGAGATRNAGIALAQGKYVAFLDADDIWCATKLEQQVAILAAHPEAGMLYGNTTYWRSWAGGEVTEQNDYLPLQGLPTNQVIRPPDLLIKLLDGVTPIPHMSSIIVRKEVINRIGAFAEGFNKVYEDQIFIARVCLEVPVYVSPEVWDRYRLWEGSSYPSAERLGEERIARHAYLNWLSEHVRSHPAQHPKLNRAISETLAAEHPINLAKARRYLRRMGRKLRARFFAGNH
jgi:glycosyltransferase involved in cell wall biosynthesis